MSVAVSTSLTPFSHKLGAPLLKKPISVLQINLGKRCNLTCSHCHVEAGPNRTEEMLPEVCEQLIELIQQFPQIKTVDLTGGAPEMLYGFKPLVEVARKTGKQVIARSNLTIYFEPGFEDIPSYCAAHQVRIVASLPCYLSENVDKMRGKGVFDASVQALQKLNSLGYGQNPELILDLVYNPPVPSNEKFGLTPDQAKLQVSYKTFLSEHFGISFNNLFAITNLPIGRTKFHLEHRQLERPYLQFLEAHFNPVTVAQLMCRDELSIDYRGIVYDCDFNQMADLPAIAHTDTHTNVHTGGQALTVAKLLALGSLEQIHEIRTASYCYGCTAGSGSSCGGALL